MQLEGSFELSPQVGCLSQGPAASADDNQEYLIDMPTPVKMVEVIEGLQEEL